MSVPLQGLNYRLSLARIIALVFSAAFITSEQGNAQQDSPRGTNPTPADSIAAIAAWAKSDTGRMMPGYRDLSRYDNPGMCLAAIRGVQDSTWRRRQLDTVHRYTAGDTIPTAAREIGRACLAKMTPQSVDSSYLYDLMRAALQVGDTALARKTVVYHASKVTRSAKERGFTILDAMEFAFKTHPSQFVWAESLFPMIAALGAEAIEPLRAAVSLRRSHAYLRFDTAAMVRLGKEVDDIFRRLLAEGAISDSSDLGETFRDSIAIVKYQRDPNLLESMRRLGDRYVAMYSSSEMGRIFAEGNIDGDMGTAKILGTPAPKQLTMFRHYPADAPTGPVPGRVTIVVYADALGGGFMEPYLATLRRLHEKYHKQGLDIAVIVQTQGFAWASPPLDSAQEAKLIGWYYRDHLKLPFTIFVSARELGRLPDGRITRTPSKTLPKIGPHRYWRPWWGYVVARDGTILLPLNRPRFVAEREAMVEAYVRQELGIRTQAVR